MTQKTDKKYLERWANMYSLARSIPRDKRFNMAFWAQPNDSTACGTSACMGGHAALHPWFRRRGLIPTFRDNAMSFKYLSPFWGLDNGEMVTPFEPNRCRVLAGMRYNLKITPKRGAKAVMVWMLKFWTKDQVEAAISKATATYDPKWVHKYTPWECPTET